MVDAGDLKSPDCKVMRVRFPPRAPPSVCEGIQMGIRTQPVATGFWPPLVTIWTKAWLQSIRSQSGWLTPLPVRHRLGPFPNAEARIALLHTPFRSRGA